MVAWSYLVFWFLSPDEGLGELVWTGVWLVGLLLFGFPFYLMELHLEKRRHQDFERVLVEPLMKRLNDLTSYEIDHYAESLPPGVVQKRWGALTSK